MLTKTNPYFANPMWTIYPYRAVLSGIVKLRRDSNLTCPIWMQLALWHRCEAWSFTSGASSVAKAATIQFTVLNFGVPSQALLAPAHNHLLSSEPFQATNTTDPLASSYDYNTWAYKHNQNWVDQMESNNTRFSKLLHVLQIILPIFQVGRRQSKVTTSFQVNSRRAAASGTCEGPGAV